MNLIWASSKTSDGNMSFKQGDAREVVANRTSFLNSVHLNLNQIVAMSPQHTDKITEVTKKDLAKGSTSLENAFLVDGLIANQPGVNLFLVLADCQGIRLYDPEHQAIGLIHAGWRSLDLDIFLKAVKAMTKAFGTDPKKLKATFSPSIGPCCYKPAFPDTPSRLKNYVKKYDDKEYSADVWTYTEDQLKQAGLLDENIDKTRICTYHSSDYFSHRRFDNEKLENDYRFATVFGIKS